MIDPIQTLAFAIQTHPGVYALLLGSGVSRAAGIPTGWDIVLDLIGKLAAATNDAPGPDLEQWYKEKYGKEPDYSSLLDSLAKTSTERQQLLRPYFEPTDQERQDDLKLPTKAHRAIARLVRQGFIKVIVTTNFDRLIEVALQEEGVSPEVLSSPDQVSGALPLTHVQCRVLKLNGDYLDTRIRNTPTELDGYPQELKDLLDRIFDEFGLVVCGWSAAWDGGLRDAIYRAPSRRFTTFWATRGELTEMAKGLIGHRRAEVLHINDANTFFQTIEETVKSIQEFSRPHPLSTAVAVASLKRYLPNPENRIRLVDLIDATVEQVINDTSGEGFEVQGAPQPTRELVTLRLRRYESACSTLLSMATIGGFWAEDDHYYGWERALERLGSTRFGGRYDVWVASTMHPGRLLLYALGLGAVESNRLHFLNRVFKTAVTHYDGGNNSAAILTSLFEPNNRRLPWHQLLEGMKGRYEALSDWIHDALRQYLKPLIPDDDKYDLTFDKLEILIALGFGPVADPLYKNWFPPGAFIYRSQNRERIITEFVESIWNSGVDSPFVQCRIFGDTPEECLKSLEDFKRLVTDNTQRRGIFS